MNQLADYEFKSVDGDLRQRRKNRTLKAILRGVRRDFSYELVFSATIHP